ncbi:tetratricopeptide repeat protein [Chitinolyticbacter meiyuanensis]|uniref:tetratricopeptide repeat protein n=1 Tax=Chitinolyticbacter meiyuanensis TaxID=682798 RepID=UPI0011E5EA5D|nr:tetratricopeptide repeat protein [Chitinolyticbacter meiyuanensis]
MQTPEQFLAEFEPLAAAARNGSPERPEVMADWLARAKRLGDAVTIARVYVTLGHAHQHVGALPRAQAAFRAAIPLFDEARHDRDMIEAQLQLGHAYYVAGAYQRALSVWLDSLSRVHAMHDIENGARVYLGVGKVYYAIEDYATALAYHEFALKLAEPQGDPYLSCEVLINIAGDAYRQQVYDRALAALKEAGGLLRGAVRNQVWEAEVRSYHGLIHYARGDYPAARTALEGALAIHRLNQNRWGLAHVLLALGRTLLRLDQHDEAEAALQEAMQLAGDAGMTTVQRDAADLLADLALRRNDHRAALAAYKHLAALACPDDGSAMSLRTGAAVAERLRRAMLQTRIEQTRLRLGA